MNLNDVQRAAVSLFARKGYAATGIRELGREVGLNSATLYHYAGGKEELLAGIMTLCLDELLRAGREAISTTVDPAAQLGKLVATHVGLSAMNPLTARVTDREVRSLTPEKWLELVALRDDYESLFAQVLERGSRTGIFRIDDPKVVRLALVEMCNGVANWYRPEGELSVQEVQERFILLAGRLVAVDDLNLRVNVCSLAPLRLPTEPRAAADDLSGPRSRV